MSGIGTLLSIPKHFLTGIVSVLSSGRLLALFTAQAFLGLLAYGVMTWLTYRYKDEITGLFVGNVDSTGETILSFVVFIVSLAANGILAYLLMTLVGGFLMEWFAQLLLEKERVPVDAEFSTSVLVRSLVRSLKVTLLRLLAGGFVMLVFLGGLVFPPLSVAASILVMFLVGVDFLELPSSVLQPAARRSIRLLSEHKLVVFAFGATATACLAVPVVGLLFIPVIAAAAAHLIAALYREQNKE